MRLLNQKIDREKERWRNERERDGRYIASHPQAKLYILPEYCNKSENTQHKSYQKLDVEDIVKFLSSKHCRFLKL